MFSFFKKSPKKETSSGIFIPKGSEFIEFEDGLNKSINDVAILLGYNTDEVYSHFISHDLEKDDIYAIIFVTFTKEIAFIVTKKNVVELNSKQINSIVKKLSFHEIYPDYQIEGILEDGVENKSLNINFLHKVLKLNDNAPNSILNCDMLGYYLEFNDGYLVDFQPSDTLNVWAKSVKNGNPKFMALYENEAKEYWGSKNMNKIINEINAQFEAYANVPKALESPFIKYHTNKSGTINFFNLLIAHHNFKVTLDEFMEMNHGRFQPIEINSYKVGEFIYEFDEFGEIQNVIHER